MQATNAAGNESRLSFVEDKEANVRYLVDTGVEVSVVPPSLADKQHRAGVSLRAANDFEIKVYGKRTITLNLDLCRVFRWLFIIADIEYAILGIDFFQHCDDIAFISPISYPILLFRYSCHMQLRRIVKP